MTSPEVLIELGLVLIGLAILARLAGRLRIPAIPLYLLAGLVFGEGGVRPLVTTVEFIEVGAEIGLILLLFSLGLEYSARELITTARAQAPAGFVDLLLNFTPGFVAGLVLGLGPTAATLLGGVTYMSSSGAIAKLLHDLGWTGNRETPTVITLLVVEDLAMAFYLPITAALLIGGGFRPAGLITSALAVIGVGLVLYVALHIEVGISRFLFSRSDEALVFTILGVTIFVAGVAELVQISAAVGALLVGIVVSGPAAEGARELLTPMRDFFAAMFFAFFGLTVDPASIPPVLVAAIVLTVVTSGTKYLTGWWSAGRAGVGARGRTRAAVLLFARGEFSLVIAAIATASGFETVGPLAVSYVLLTLIVGPVTTRILETLAEHREAASEGQRATA